jgi:hypothetical protein
MFLICAASALAPSAAFANGGVFFNKTCQFPLATDTASTGLFGNWPGCGDVGGPLVPHQTGECTYVTDVTLVSNNPLNGGTTGHLIVLEDGNHPATDTVEYPFVVPAPGTVTQDFQTPLIFTSTTGLFVFDRSPGNVSVWNPNVLVTVSGYYSFCPLELPL